MWALLSFTWVRKSNRQWRSLLAGLPLLLAVVGVFYLAIAIGFKTDDDLRSRYLSAAEVSTAKGQHKVATLMFERATAIRKLSDRHLFLLAMSAHKSGQIAKGSAIVQMLAPLDYPRHAQSHFWRAAQLTEKAKRTPKDVESAEKHLKHVLALDPSNHNAHAALATLYYETGQHELAVTKFQHAVNEHPELLLSFAKSLAFLGRSNEAKLQGERSLHWLDKKTRSEPQNTDWWYRAADACMFMTEFAKASEIVERLIQKNPDERKYAAALATVYVGWEQSLQGSSMDVDQKRLELLSRATEVFPDNIGLFSGLMKLLGSRNDVSDQLEAFLNQNIADGKAMGLSHLILGSKGFINQSEESSAVHLERAMELMPNAPIVANNMAWHLLQNEPIQPEVAFDIVNPVIERLSPKDLAKTPELVALWDTRGVAWLKLGKYREAVSDLEYAVENGLNGTPSTHAGLAEAYQQLGLVDLAKEHRKRSE